MSGGLGLGRGLRDEGSSVKHEGKGEVGRGLSLFENPFSIQIFSGKSTYYSRLVCYDPLATI